MYGGVRKRTVPDTEQGIAVAVEGTKGDGKPASWEGRVRQSGLEAVSGKTLHTEF